MKYYFAPMEGVTGYIYRSAHHDFFKHIDKYFIPFIVPSQSKKFSPREQKDILPEHNEGLNAVPQILTNKAEDFLGTVSKLQELGYEEINLNLGCPSRTVVSKNRGSGFLAMQEELHRFLEEVFSKTTAKISVKTRIGKTDADEFYELIEIFNEYPMEELIVHPRLQTDYYKNKPNLAVYRDAVRLSKNPLCYNGDIFTLQNFHEFKEEFPETDCIMLGRGLIANPCLAEKIEDGKSLDKETFMQFHDRLLTDYQEAISGDRNLLFKMKELWIYMGCIFEDGEKYTKKIKKASRLDEYRQAVSALLAEKSIREDGGYFV